MKPEDRGAVRLTDETCYFPALTNSGYKGGCLIDTGPDEYAYDGIEIGEVLITHGHADHFSSAAYLQRETGAMIMAPREEVALIENPEMNIRGMFSWAKPSDEMVTKLFRGEGCRVDGFLDQWHDSGIEAVPLIGHTLGHTGFLTDDGVFFSGDGLYKEELWQTHPLPYSIDVGLTRTSLEMMKGLEFEWLVPAHGDPVRHKEALVHIDHHLERITAIEDLILEMLRDARTTEKIVAMVSGALKLKENPAQYWLSVTTVKSYLSDLMQQKRIGFTVTGHAGHWAALQ